jgi:diacylglycerol kinase family enzyme
MNGLPLRRVAAPERDMPEHRYHIIFNPGAGTALVSGLTTAILRERFEGAGLRFDIDDEEASAMADRIDRALAGPAEVVVAAGGDGTVLAVAERLVGQEKMLAILPLGTMNALARDLGLPLELDAAIEALGSLEPRAIDVAEVNGRPFLHNVILGLIPGIAVGREQVRGKGWLQRLAFGRFMVRRQARERRIALALAADTAEPRVERLQTLVVANNSYEQRFGRIMSRRRIDRGTLTVYMIRSLRLPDAIRLAVEMFLGAWREDEVIEFEQVKRLTVASKKRNILATMDGEVLTLTPPLDFRVRPKSLRVLAPPEQTAAPDGERIPEAAA